MYIPRKKSRVCVVLLLLTSPKINLRSFKRLLIVSSNGVSLFPVNYTLQIELGPGVNKKHIVAVDSLSSSSVQVQQL